MILEDILGEIGKSNNLSNFPTKLSFEEANIRLVNYNKATKQKEEKVGATCHHRPIFKTRLMLIIILIYRLNVFRNHSSGCDFG